MKHSYLAKLMFLLLLAGLGFPSSAFAQTGSVSGRVLDSKKEGIPGATVLIEGISLGSSSNVDGTYNIQNVPAGPQTLIISFVGFNTVRRSVTVVAGQNTEISADLTENATQLSEAIVVGYGTQRRQDVTGSVATVDERQFVKGQVTNPEQLIQGKVAGVQITTGGGAPGSGTQVRIRGGSSLSTTNEPLYIIDGVPIDNSEFKFGDNKGVTNPLTLINPNDIETFTVLKDASATAIYGSRASNGVILITTKKGAAGETFRLNFSSQFSISKRTRSVNVLSADEFRAYVLADTTTTPSTTPGGPRVRAPRGSDLLGTANTNWQDEIFRTAYTFDNNVSLSGTAAKVPYRISYGNLRQEGILKTSELKRNSLSVGLTPRLFNDALRIDINLKGSITDNTFADEGAIGNAIRFNPTQPILSGSPAFGGYYEDLEGTRPNSLAPRNPIGQLALREATSRVKRSIGNIQLDYKLPFVSGLRANFNLGYDVLRSDGNTFVPNFSALQIREVTRPELNGENNPYSQNRNNWLNEFYLNYTREFESAGRVEVLAGHSFQEFFRRAPNFIALTATNIPQPNAATPAYAFAGGEYALESYYTRLNYSLKNRYLLTATVRADRSSRFAPANRTGYFPAVAVGYRLKEESFLRDSKLFSDLKLRAGYGITGQQEVGDQFYGYLATYLLSEATASYQLGNNFIRTYRPQGYFDNLKWEETSTLNAGLDYGLLDNRLSGTVDVYLRKTDRLLNFTSPPAGSNTANELFFNVGSLENRGVEFALNAVPIQSTNFNWNVNFNVAFNRTKLTKLTLNDVPGGVGQQTGDISGSVGQRIQVQTVGFAPQSFYVYKQKYNDRGQPIQSNNVNGGINAFEDLNGDGQITPADKYRYKQAAPVTILGFSSNMNYRNLSLAFTLRSNLGNYVYNNVNSDLGYRAGTYGNGVLFLNNRVQDALATGFDAVQRESDYYVTDASFVRMDNATLGYNFDKVMGKKANLGLSFAVQNAFVITKYKGIDPEINNGIDRTFYPRPRTYTFGLNVGF